LTLGGKSYKKLKTDTHPIMHFNPDQWNCHKQGQQVRETILENLPADINTLCQLTQRSPIQVKRHLATLRAEGKLKGIISVALIGFCLLVPNCAMCQQPEAEFIFIENSL
jgi:hypothetical protein